MAIEKIRVDSLSPEEFLERYFVPEKPVILTDVQTAPKSQKLELRELAASLCAKQIDVNKTWFQSRADELDIGEIPRIVHAALDPKLSQRREKYQRIWVNPKGHLTPWHSDVNALFVFNLQLQGKKKWKILGPDSGLSKYPFSQIALTKYNGDLPMALADRVIEFDLECGEMLFMPPFWDHQVTSLHDVNINVNWVGTKKLRAKSIASQRELENLAIAHQCGKFTLMVRLFDFLLGSNEPDYLKNYAGVGGDLVSELVRDILPSHCVRRLIQESRFFFDLIQDRRTLLSYQVNPRQQIRRLLEKEAHKPSIRGACYAE